MRRAMLAVAAAATLGFSRDGATERLVRVERWENGTKKAEVPLLNGRFHGTVRAWYPGGSPMWTRTYVRGVEQGEHQGWWPDGTLKFSYSYVKGVREGESREWHANGRLFHLATYRGGHEEGRQRSWDADGTPRAAYDVVNGRRYGTIGTMGCTPGNRGAGDSAPAAAPGSDR